ncbi:hypothetical protein GCM10007301_10330 [Azorhizobium oxalatiphilum]|uniref:Uncharacterized protein n=1 Tax=Azorhizobium oxalatiphilum TaxID=980631 RepID=A0A917BNE0_9HYPH|nr:hypothetical protein GCM10007301_10330 [Azorhizobium oxalatiphilum]
MVMRKISRLASGLRGPRIGNPIVCPLCDADKARHKAKPQMGATAGKAMPGEGKLFPAPAWPGRAPGDGRALAGKSKPAVNPVGGARGREGKGG